MLTLYENIKRLRKENNLTQEQLAIRMGYGDRSTIAKIEAGKVDLSQSKILEFAKVFGVDAGELMGYDGTASLPTDTPEAKRIRDLYAIVPPEILDDPEQYAQIKDLVDTYLNADANGRSALVGLLKNLQPKS